MVTVTARSKLSILSHIFINQVKLIDIKDANLIVNSIFNLSLVNSGVNWSNIYLCSLICPMHWLGSLIIT